MAAEDPRNPSEPPPPPGTPPTQIGSYRLVHPLGSGGMSSVFLATHVDTGLEVALKVLPRSLAKNPTLLQRFLREAKVAEALEHPNIVAIYDRGVEDGRYYLVLEYISGGDLHDWVRTKGPMSVDQSVSVLQGVVRALDYAASQGLIHRDLKPANILFTVDGTPKLADLGLAVQLSEEDERVTRDGTTVGTVDYMSPEQARDSRATSAQSDMYSLGCTLYHLLTGAAPFAGGTVPEKLKRHATEPPPNLRTARPDVPEELAQIVRTLLAKKSERRYRSYADLLAALDAVPITPATHEGPLFALVDDGPDDSPPAGGDFLRTADTGASTSTKDLAARVAPARPTEKPSRSRPEINLSELAALEDDSAGRASRSRSRAASSPSLPVPGVDNAGASTPMRSLPAPTLAPRPTGNSSADLHEGILRGLLIGTGLALLAVVLIWVARGGGGSSPSTNETQEGVAEKEPAWPVNPGRTGNDSQTGTATTSPPLPAAAITRQAAPWTEPAEPVVDELPAEPALPERLVEGLVPAWARADVAAKEPVQRLERVPDRRQGPAPSTLVQALGSPAPTVEIADNGPFFLRDIPLASRSRSIRAAKGFRPSIVVSGTSLAPRSTALVNIENSDLFLEGLDLVVPLDEVPANLSALFACRAGTLTLVNCSISFVGPENRRMCLARLGEELRPPRPPRRGFASSVAGFEARP